MTDCSSSVLLVLQELVIGSTLPYELRVMPSQTIRKVHACSCMTVGGFVFLDVEM